MCTLASALVISTVCRLLNPRLILFLLLGSHGSEDGGLDPVQKEVLAFCPHLGELPEIFSTFWQHLHKTALAIEQHRCKTEG